MSRTPKYANRNSGLLQVQVCAGSSPAFGIAIARGAKVARRAIACACCPGLRGAPAAAGSKKNRRDEPSCSPPTGMSGTSRPPSPL